MMGRTKGSTTAAKVVKSDSGNKEATKVSSHGYTPEETEAAFFLFMEDQKKKEPGLKLSDAVGLWNALPVNEKNVSIHVQASLTEHEKYFCVSLMQEYRKNARKLFEEYEADKKANKGGEGDSAMTSDEMAHGVASGVSSEIQSGVTSGATSSAASVVTDHGMDSTPGGEPTFSSVHETAESSVV